MNELISVIVPVYNTDKYLDRCIESIVNQTYTNLEIILVDDGSQDDSPSICDSWTKRDSRIRVLHKENGGAADAKNCGLDAATGELIGFVDSDDVIDPLMYVQLYSLLKQYNADIVDSQIKIENNYTSIEYCKEQNVITAYSSESALRELMRDKTIRQTPVNKLYKRSVIDNIRFVKGKYIDDEYWTYRVIGNCKKYIFTSKYFYFYVQHSESAMNRPYSIRRFDVFDAFLNRYHYMQKFYPELQSIALSAYESALRYHYQYISRLKGFDDDHKHRDMINNRFNDVYSKDLYKGLSLKEKIWLWLFRLSPDFCCKIRNTLKIGL